MKLQNDFYRIEQQNGNGEEVRFSIIFNPAHFIFKAHFPQKPVTPGVCTIQMITELAETVLQKQLRLVIVKNVKFIALLSPEEVLQVFADLKIKQEAGSNRYIVKAEVLTAQQVYAKLSLIYE